MKKRKIGMRAEILLDEIDLAILDIAKSKEVHGLGVLELAREINLSPKSLFPHLRKLINADLVVATRERKFNRLELSDGEFFDKDLLVKDQEFITNKYNVYNVLKKIKENQKTDKDNATLREDVVLSEEDFQKIKSKKRSLKKK